MTALALPPEIIEDHIIDNLADHPASLAACALVCKAWVNASQKRIFFHVEIRASVTVSGELVCNKFNSLLTRSPHIAPYVSDIFIADGMESRRWMTRSKQTLSAILSKLVNLTKVHIALASLPWTEASSIRDVLRGFFRQPKIRKIILRGLSLLPSWDELFYMLNGSRADHVLLYAVILDPGTSKRASRRRRGLPIQRPRSTIGCLETNSSVEDLEDFGFWADNPKSCLDISSLSKFSFDIMRVEDIAGCNAVLQAEAFRSLEIFEVVVESFSEAATTQLDFSRTLVTCYDGMHTFSRLLEASLSKR
ncbi:hypothetical protein BDZ89DRAFT_201467 [Hymenopellis radicata]|nr:hypothetical protein BDZ89DRAFT_201467 [Hymenopellis radicata]